MIYAALARIVALAVDATSLCSEIVGHDFGFSPSGQNIKGGDSAAPAPRAAPIAPDPLFGFGGFPVRPTPEVPAKTPPPPDSLKELFSVNDAKKTVSLRVIPDATNGKSYQVGDAMLLILYGYRKFFQVDEIAAMDMSAAIRDSGLGQGARVDLANRALTADGLATKNGAGRGLNYRITNKGTIRAESILSDLWAKVL